MRIVAVNFIDSECMILRMPSLRKFMCYSVLVCIQNKAPVPVRFVDWKRTCMLCDLPHRHGEIFVSRMQLCVRHYFGSAVMSVVLAIAQSV